MPIPQTTAAPPPRTSGSPLCELGDISVRAIRLAEDPEFVERIAQLRAAAFGDDGPWNYGLDTQDQQAIQLVAFDASGPVGALRLCLGDELLAHGGFDAFYMNTGWELEPRSEAFFATALEYGRFWVVRGHPRTRGIIDALLSAIGAFSTVHPRYQNVFGTVALLDHTPESCRLVVDYLRRYHLPDARWVRPRRPIELDEGAPSAPASSLPPRSRAFRGLVHQQRQVDPDHPLPFLLHLYLRQGAQMLGDVAWDGSGRKLLIPLYISTARFEEYMARLQAHAGASPRPDAGPESGVNDRPWSGDAGLL